MPSTTRSETEDGSAAHPYKTIQAAVDAGSDNRAIRIQVAPGVYGGTREAAKQVTFEGSDSDGGLATVWIPGGNSLFIRSDDGAEQTVIRGVWADTETGIGKGAVRCVAVTSTGRPVGLSGFTLENGATLVSTNAHAGWGGGFCSVRTASSALAPNHQLIDSIVRNYATVRVADFANGDYRPLAGEPVVGGGSSAYTFYGRHAGTDFDNNPVVGSNPTVDANGKVVLTSGAFVKPVSAVVVSEADGVVATPGGTNVVAVGETKTVTISKDATCARNLLGLVVDGVNKEGVFSWTLTGTDPATRVTLEPLFASDWYAADQADPPQVRSNGDVVKNTNLGDSFEADWQAYGVGTNGSVKCVTLQPNARIRGFTLTGGRTGCPEDVTADYTLGAAVLGYDVDTSVVEDCLISNNVSGRAVVYNATAINCDILAFRITSRPSGGFSRSGVNRALRGFPGIRTRRPSPRMAGVRRWRRGTSGRSPSSRGRTVPATTSGTTSRRRAGIRTIPNRCMAC